LKLENDLKEGDLKIKNLEDKINDKEKLISMLNDRIQDLEIKLSYEFKSNESYKNEINNLLEKLNSAFSEIAELSTIAKNLTKALREARDQLQSGNEDDTSKFMDSLEDIKEKNNQLKFRISELEKQLEDARKQAQRLMNSVPGDSGMVDMLRTTIKELEEELNKIKQENKELDEITTTLDEQLKQLTKNIRHKNSVTKKNGNNLQNLRSL